MKAIVIDAGPLISFFHKKDPEHQESVKIMQELQKQKIAILIPIPILFEVYKWLLYHVNYNLAQSTLEIMRESFNLVPIGESELVAATNLMKTIQNWNGSLEDAIVIITAKRYKLR